MLNSIPEILEDLKAGRMVIVVDDEERENEGDLVLAAQFASPEAVAKESRAHGAGDATQNRAGASETFLGRRQAEVGFKVLIGAIDDRRVVAEQESADGCDDRDKQDKPERALRGFPIPHLECRW
jgi:hypothetical protein